MHIKPHVGADSAKRKSPANKIGGAKPAMTKGRGIKMAGMAKKASFNHTAKPHKTSDWKG